MKENFIRKYYKIKGEKDMSRFIGGEDTTTFGMQYDSGLFGPGANR